MKGERRRIWKCLLFAVLLTLLAFVSVGCAGDTRTVCSTGCNYTKIQHAIEASLPQDTIEVYSGTYYENVHVDKPLILRGINTGSGKPVVDANGSGSAIMVFHEGIVLDGFTAINASNDSEAGILVYSNNNIIINNTASNNTNGIRLDSSSNNSLTGNTASNNSDYGIRLVSSSNNFIYNNYFDNPRNAYDDGTNIWNITKTEGMNIIGGPNLGGNYWGDYTGTDADGDKLGDTPYDIYGTTKDNLPLVATAPHIFDTGKGDYPSIMGTHNGTIKLNQTITVSKLYTYPCEGTGGHTEYVKIWNSSDWNVTATWNGYTSDWRNLTFNKTFTLYASETYNYTLRTGTYPQIIHAPEYNATGGVITCSEFVDINGKRHEGGIPAIRLY